MNIEVFIIKNIMDKNRFKELLRSTMGDVRTLVSEQPLPPEPTPPQPTPPQPTPSLTDNSKQNMILVNDTMKIIRKVTPITDEEISDQVYWSLKVLFGATSKKGLDQRMREYNNIIKKYDLYRYLPSSELIVKLKELQ